MSNVVPPPCRVLIVDDSTVFRSQTQLALTGLPEIEVVGTASNGKMALEFLKSRVVDVMTLDLEMPVMDGLDTLAEVKRLGIKVNTIVFSAHSKAGAESTLKALQLGASDFLTKPTLGPDMKMTPSELIRSHLHPKVLQFRTVKNQGTPVALQAPKLNLNISKPKVVVIASSTGGPTALETIFSTLRPNLTVPIVIAQHMPPIFTASLAERIQKISGIACAEAVSGEPLLPGKIYIAPGDYHLTIEGTATAPKLMLNQGPQRNSVRPCADFLFESAAKIFQKECLGIVLTGMGADGRDGAVAVKKSGGGIMIQSKETCVVWGMPAAVFECNAYDQIGSLQQISGFLNDLVFNKSLAKAV